jgi:hypothetical protein
LDAWVEKTADAAIDFLVDHSGWTFDELKEKPCDIDQCNPQPLRSQSAHLND